MSVDVSKVPELVNHEALPVLIDAYEGEERIYPSVVNVMPVTPETEYGDKIPVITRMGGFIEREDGQEVQSDEFRTARTAYLKTKQFSRFVAISERMMRSADALAKITKLTTMFAESFGENAAIEKDELIADMFQKGTLTAGSAQFFDGTHVGEADPNPTVIYDGLPWFDTAHTQIIGGNTFSNHVASSALTNANLIAAWEIFTSTNAFDERNRRVSLRPNTLMVPPGLESEALTLVQSDRLPGTAQNDINFNKGRYGVVVNPYLDDSASASSWWMGAAGKGIQARDSGTPNMRLAFNDDHKEWRVYFEYQFGAAVDNWRYWLARNKAAA